MSPEQPIASSSACGARTTADFGRSDPNTRGERDRCRPRARRRARGSRCAVSSISSSSVIRRPPADGRRRVEDRQLLDRLRLLVERAVDQARVGVLDRAGAAEALDDPLGQVPDRGRVGRVAEVEDRALRIRTRRRAWSVMKRARSVALRKARSCPPPAKTVSGRPASACCTNVGITNPPARDWRGPATLNGRMTNARRPRWRLLIVAASVSVLAIAYSRRAL